mmetsp:Transcript_68650/g.213147  ORF Transcript_68650/g.213147 Transcript_68650/m.213147 type:complete len:516 (-) Transcript_68650:205-1752(-)
MATQEWMDQRLEGLLPTDFGEQVRVHCVTHLEPPPGFEDVWTVGPPGVELPIHTITSGAAVLLFGDLGDEAQTASVRHLITSVDQVGAHAAPVIYIHHSADSENEAEGNEAEAGAVSLAQEVIAQHILGLDAAILEPWEGLRLALQVRASIRSIAHLCATASAKIEEQRALSAQANNLHQAINELIWSYSANVLGQQCLPAIDESIGTGIPRSLAGCALGRKLGFGSCGSVFELIGQGSPCVVKAVDKRNIGDIDSLRCLIRSIAVQKALNGDRWRHPNIGQLLQVYHSPTHILFRLENAGPQNLYKRLRGQRLSVAKVASVMQQASAAVAHLHLGPGICHRDIKPENFVVEEGSHGVRIKLIDFDMSFFPKPGARGRNRCGTLPFTAPEILLAESHLPLPTDLWSLGLVMLEVTCGAGFLTHILGMELPRGQEGRDFEERSALFCQEVQRFFSPPGSASRVLNESAHKGLGELLPRSGPLLDGLLEVDVSRRWTAKQLSQAIIAGLLEEQDPHA